MVNPSGPPTALDSLTVAGVPTMGMGGGWPMFTGNWYFVDFNGGSDGGPGTALQPFKTIYKAFSVMTSGNEDVCVVLSNGGTSGMQRLSLAGAQVFTPAATAGTLNWNKNACHLIGTAPPTLTGNRSRIAPPTGTYTQATFGSGNFVTVSGTGCYFANFEVATGFSTGGTNQICWTDSGGFNYYNNVSFAGANDTASAADTGSRSLKITGTSGNNTFVACTIGTDATTRGVANAALELAGATPRNVFKDCIFPVNSTAAGVLSILCTGANAIASYQLFKGCWFPNLGTAQTVISSMTSGTPGGVFLMDNCGRTGAASKWGDANGLANTFVLGATPVAASNGLGINPS